MRAGSICLQRRWAAASAPPGLCAAGTASDQPAVCIRLAGVRQGPQRPHRRSKQALLALIHVFDHPFRQGEHGYPLFYGLPTCAVTRWNRTRRMNEIHQRELRIFAVSPLSLASRTQKLSIHLHTTHTLDPPKPNYGEANGCFVFLLCGFLHRDY